MARQVVHERGKLVGQPGRSAAVLHLMQQFAQRVLMLRDTPHAAQQGVQAVG